MIESISSVGMQFLTLCFTFKWGTAIHYFQQKKDMFEYRFESFLD